MIHTLLNFAHKLGFFTDHSTARRDAWI